MPRFYFHVFNHMIMHDPEGQELPGIEAAVREARNAAADLISDDIKAGRLINPAHRIEVMDAQQRRVHVLHFGDLLRERSPRDERD
jgi:hypothetical protein